ncbi:MAG: Fe-S cluster assembly protein HesB [Acidimicrobiia bacterium]|nr:Fe-S cluster assembly protein HesB [Acidimicrobiia bacterium]
MTTIHFTDTAEANDLLATNDFAMLVGMTLYQQVPVEKAFAGPAVLQQRMGCPIDAATVASMDPEKLGEIFSETPAIHRFPANMAKRTQAVASHIVDQYGGDVAGLWTDVADAKELLKRIKAMPGFGDYKAKVYAAVLARHFGIQPAGWNERLPDWPNISEVTSDVGRSEMKERKKVWKAAKT